MYEVLYDCVSCPLSRGRHTGRRNLSLVQFLLRCGAEANIADRGRKTPLHVASKAARPELVKELLTFGAHVNHQDSSGQTAMHLAAVFDITGHFYFLENTHTDEESIQFQRSYTKTRPPPFGLNIRFLYIN